MHANNTQGTLALASASAPRMADALNQVDASVNEIACRKKKFWRGVIVSAMCGLISAATGGAIISLLKIAAFATSFFATFLFLSSLATCGISVAVLAITVYRTVCLPVPDLIDMTVHGRPKQISYPVLP